MNEEKFYIDQTNFLEDLKDLCSRYGEDLPTATLGSIMLSLGVAGISISCSEEVAQMIVDDALKNSENAVRDYFAKKSEIKKAPETME